MSKEVMEKELKEVKQNKRNKLIVGGDWGNGFVKIYTVFKGKEIILVVASGYVYKVEIETEEGKLSDTTLKSYSTKLGGIEYVFGKNVDRFSQFISLEASNNRYNNDEFQLFISALLYQAIGKEIEDYEICVVSGVPSIEKNNKGEKELKQTILNAPTIFVNGEKVIVNIKEVEIVAQPIGTLMDLLLDNNGIINSNNGLGRRNVIIDIGKGTVDGEQIEDLNPLVNYRFSTNDGTNVVINKLIDFIQRESGVTVSSGEIMEQFDNDIFVLNKHNSYNWKKIKEDAIEMATTKIAIEVRKRIKNVNAIDDFIITGGGAKMYGEKLMEKLKEFNPTIIEKDNQIANARGFYKLGLTRFKN